MTTGCGYVCPLCEGKGITQEGENCTWCSTQPKSEITDEQWKKQVHEGKCCADEE